jgi:hypothetical protein
MWHATDVSGQAPRPATHEDVPNAPAEVIAEVLTGTLHTQPRPPCVTRA